METGTTITDGIPSGSAMVLRFPASDGSRLSLSLGEATGKDVLSSTVALEIAKEWEELWRKCRPLSKEQQRGLIAELIVSAICWSTKALALSMWKGGGCMILYWSPVLSK